MSMERWKKAARVTKHVERGDNVRNIEDKDFQARFDGIQLTKEYLWKGKTSVCQNRVTCYKHTLKGGARIEFESRVDQWIDESILRSWKGEEPNCVLPIMVVVQPTKKKVRPVLDFRELSKYMSCHTDGGAADVCGETSQVRRCMTGVTTIVNVKSAYLQLHVSEKLWQYQLVRFKGRTYYLTWLGFGLSLVQKVTTKVLKTILGKVAEVKEAISSYIEDILMDENVAMVEEVVNHLKKFRQTAKAAEAIERGAVLGFKIERGRISKLVF